MRSAGGAQSKAAAQKSYARSACAMQATAHSKL